MRDRQLQAAAQALLALLDPAPASPARAAESGASTETPGAAVPLEATEVMNYVNQMGDVADRAAARALTVPVGGETLPLAELGAEPGAARRRAGVAEPPLAGAADGSPVGATAPAEGWTDPTGAMEDIDRFFRRDSRRYDGGFAPS